MIRRDILIFGLVLGLGVVDLPSKAYAGFEFIAPKQNAAPAPTINNPAWQAPQPVISPVPAPVASPLPSVPMMPPSILPSQTYQAPPALPPVPVAQVPLQQPMVPSPVSDQQVIAPVPNIVPSIRPTGLVIDPYPLRNNQTARLMPSNQAVATTMAETAGALRPVQLGAGMTTGVQADQLQNNQVQTAPRPPQRLVGDTSLTPIPGGEPAPLPGIDLGVEQAYYDPNFVQSAPVTYANAVGFARDIPLPIALEQIIPDGFTSRFIDMPSQGNLMVSWEGGEPWNVVLNNMLRAHNLTATITGQTVTIRPMARL